MRSFITGSYAYGAPKWDSDIDMVVLVSKPDLTKLRQLADNKDELEQVSGYGEATTAYSLRFGKLNLLACLSVKDFEVWKAGTRALTKLGEKYGQISHDYACIVFRALRNGEEPPKYRPPEKKTGKKPKSPKWGFLENLSLDPDDTIPY